jgi:hypothetical protein
LLGSLPEDKKNWTLIDLRPLCTLLHNKKLGKIEKLTEELI